MYVCMHMHVNLMIFYICVHLYACVYVYVYYSYFSGLDRVIIKDLMKGMRMSGFTGAFAMAVPAALESKVCTPCMYVCMYVCLFM